MKLVVVGGVAAGLSAASRARRIDPSLDITVLEKGSLISYGACGLPYLFEGQVRAIDELTVYSPEFFERERNIRVRTNTAVQSVRHASRELLLDSGERLRYDRLIWTAGARPVSGPNDPRVHVLHTAADAAALQAALQQRQPKTVAVVGASYLGLEMVEAFRSLGLRVSLYSAGPDVLRRKDPEITRRVVERLEQCRVDVHLRRHIQDSSELTADLILWATGLRPNVELIADAGAELGRTGALAVSPRMETALHGVYAAGDCCETTHLVSGRPIWLPLGTTANKMGRVAGANAAGQLERFPGVVGTSIVRVCGLGIGMTGLSAEEARREGFQTVTALIEGRDRARYFRGRKVAVQLVADASSRRLLGAAVLGDEGVVGRINALAAALTARMKVEELEHLDLAYAPPFATAMDPILIAAQQLMKQFARPVF